MIWISNPLAYYGLLAVALVLGLYLLISMKVEIAQLRAKLEKQNLQSQEVLGQFRTALSKLDSSLQEHEQDEELAMPMRAAQGVSINLTRRSQALRMHRRGDSREQICHALQMPRNEVELLLKVQKARAEQSP